MIRKIRKFLLVVSLIILAVPVVAVLRILGIFVVIRLGWLDGGRVGHLYSADWYLSERLVGMHSQSIFDIFYFTSSTRTVSNKQWLKMWKRVLTVFPFGRFAYVVDRLNKVLPGYEVHTIPLRSTSDMLFKNDILYRVLVCNKPHLSFTQEEEILGNKLLHELGIPEGTPFICFHARDSAYLETLLPERDWSYHNYRDSCIHNHILAVEELVQRGYCAIRMGAIVKERLTTNNPAIIDYPVNGKRTDFLDIFLGAKCRFFLCSDTGISIIPEVFRVPTVYLNWVPIQRISPWVLNGLFIPKRFYLSKEQRFLTFREIMSSNLGSIVRGERFKELGIKLIENTPEEIKAVAIEMDERLKGIWKCIEEDEELQQRFWALFGPNKLKSPNLRIGAEFLRQNQNLLE